MVAADEHPDSLPGRDVPVHGVVQLAQPLLQQHHEGDGGDGLAHGIDAKHRVPVHGAAALQLEVALRLEKSDLTVTSDQGQGAGQSAVVDVALKMAADAVEAVRREADLFRFDDHRFSFARTAVGNL